MTRAEVLDKLAELNRATVVRCSRCRHALAVIPKGGNAYIDKTGEVQAWGLAEAEDTAASRVQGDRPVQKRPRPRSRRVHGADPRRRRSALERLRELVAVHWTKSLKCAELRSLATDDVPVLERAP